MRHSLFLAAIFLTMHATMRSHAQSPATLAEPSGTVTGHVFCSDTNQPARFAQVSLEPIATLGPKPSAPQPSTSAHSSGTHLSSVSTSLDGSFTLAGVKPGSYYVIVEKQGYIKPQDMFTPQQMDSTDPQLRALIDAALPRVKVDAGHTESAEVRLQRGGAISGTILYDDGTPASEVYVHLLHKGPTGKWDDLPALRGFHPVATTDDRGNFRIASLLADEYLLVATLTLSDTKTTSMPGPGGNTMEIALASIRFSLPFYGSGVPRQSQAVSIKLHSGQELTGQDMLLPLSKLHHLTGRVAAGSDGHLVNAAHVALLYRDDNSELTSADIGRDDGLFRFDFVPDGDYILKVTNARDVTWEPPPPSTTPSNPMTMMMPAPDREHVTATYGGTEQPLLLRGETLGTTITVPPNAKPAPSPTGASSPPFI